MPKYKKVLRQRLANAARMNEARRGRKELHSLSHEKKCNPTSDINYVEDGVRDSQREAPLEASNPQPMEISNNSLREDLTENANENIEGNHENIEENYENIEEVNPKALSSSSKSSNKKRKVDNTSKSNDDDSDIEDEYDGWAKECALELRQMAPDQQTFAKRAITYILMEGRLGLLHRNSVQINNTRKDHDQSTLKNPKDSLLDEFLVINQGDARPTVTVSHKTAGRPLTAKSKLLDKTGVASSETASCKTTLSGSLPFDDTGSSFIVASHKTATSVGSSSARSFCNIESSVVERQDLAAPFNSTASFVKAETCGETESNSQKIVALYNAAIDEPVSTGPSMLFVKSERMMRDDVGSCSHEIVTQLVDSTPSLVKIEACDGIDSMRSSVSRKSENASETRKSSEVVKPEPYSPPSSPDYTAVVIKDDPE